MSRATPSPSPFTIKPKLVEFNFRKCEKLKCDVFLKNLDRHTKCVTHRECAITCHICVSWSRGERHLYKRSYGSSPRGIRDQTKVKVLVSDPSKIQSPADLNRQSTASDSRDKTPVTKSIEWSRVQSPVDLSRQIQTIKLTRIQSPQDLNRQGATSSDSRDKTPVTKSRHSQTIKLPKNQSPKDLNSQSTTEYHKSKELSRIQRPKALDRQIQTKDLSKIQGPRDLNKQSQDTNTGAKSDNTTPNKVLESDEPRFTMSRHRTYSKERSRENSDKDRAPYDRDSEELREEEVPSPTGTMSPEKG
jgi:hypothetical protein